MTLSLATSHRDSILNFVIFAGGNKGALLARSARRAL
ncbi:hypothetical protein AYM02_01975 [Coxiella burnetii]|uniref:Uncharacterized protein n=2 Tax=Coxiella burnetii TaxID=777 RepID=Q83FC1_COXBU|nr:hypothetical protein [Coxiella burnetii]NP_819075.1 hypothetical protein CBU_0019 [Coxiella burnetii RSA 493]AAO89589.1 hypothetical protein CBU_0019 [Coxiella burnetii RSA 493]ACI23062.1 hypothetical protein CBUD_0141a [Coxiella burnetii Dugway 5J108-111]ACJ17724.1 hypothetical protein CbuG_0287 [Coxiella burnetii CbuG_Q212]AML48136.1 hypothetical protein AUR58_02295 [Coxiella burnetii]AML54155.1 hypothetical protein AYM38_01940 [Coxiella burnetii]